jgi:DnaK suppressor protein
MVSPSITDAWPVVPEARTAVPTSLNLCAPDLLHPNLVRLDAHHDTIFVDVFQPWKRREAAGAGYELAGPERQGNAAMNDRQDLDLDAIGRRLEGERDELLNASARAADQRRPVELDQQSVGRLSRVDALQVQAMARAVEARRRARLQRIEAALGRIEDGDYGACAECGEDIPAKRLDVDPTVGRCVDCAA